MITGDHKVWILCIFGCHSRAYIASPPCWNTKINQKVHCKHRFQVHCHCCIHYCLNYLCGSTAIHQWNLVDCYWMETNPDWKDSWTNFDCRSWRIVSWCNVRRMSLLLVVWACRSTNELHCFSYDKSCRKSNFEYFWHHFAWRLPLSLIWCVIQSCCFWIE